MQTSSQGTLDGIAERCVLPGTPTRTASPHILLAEDDDEMRTLLARAFRQEGYNVIECRDGCELADRVGSFRLSGVDDFDLVVSDIRMPGVFGLTILEGTRQWDGFPPIILITAFGDEETHAHAARLGAAAMFDKPFEIDGLLTKMREILSGPGPTRPRQICGSAPLAAARMEMAPPLARKGELLTAARFLYGSSITDGNGIVGAIRDVFFDDRLWVVSYIVVETGSWPDTRRVLLSPSIVERENWPNHLLQVSLTQQQVKDSLRVDTHPPVSQQRAIDLSGHGQPQAHWANSVEQSSETDGDPHLRSAQEVTGYLVETTDGRFGHVEDLILEDEGRDGKQWTIRYLVVHTHRWLPGGKVLVASRFIDSIDWRTQTVRVCLSRQEITDSPKFNSKTL